MINVSQSSQSRRRRETVVLRVGAEGAREAAGVEERTPVRGGGVDAVLPLEGHAGRGARAARLAPAQVYRARALHARAAPAFSMGNADAPLNGRQQPAGRRTWHAPTVGTSVLKSYLVSQQVRVLL